MKLQSPTAPLFTFPRCWTLSAKMVTRVLPLICASSSCTTRVSAVCWVHRVPVVGIQQHGENIMSGPKRCARNKAEVRAQLKRYGFVLFVTADAEKLGLGPARKRRKK